MSRLVSDLSGADLALWVARAECRTVEVYTQTDGVVYSVKLRHEFNGYIGGSYVPQFSPQVDWSQGGPLIGKHSIGLSAPIGDVRQAFMFKGSGQAAVTAYGPTALIAAMRCHVRSIYGDTVPDEVAP